MNLDPGRRFLYRSHNRNWFVRCRFGGFVLLLSLIHVELRIPEAISPIPNHLALLDGESDKLKSVPKFSLVTDQRPRAHGNANLRNPQFDRDVLPHRKFAGDHSPPAALAQVSA